MNNSSNLFLNINNLKKIEIMKTFIYNNGGYILFATAIIGTILWKVLFPHLNWK